VVLVADHGEGLMEHGEPSHSYLVYDTTMRVPLILSRPGTLPAGRRIRSLVRTVDVLPTVLDVLGVSRPVDIAGVSLAPLIAGDVADLELAAYGEATRFVATFEAAPLRFLRRGRWKYIHKVNPELYDVLADPAEVENRISDEADIAARLRAELQALLETSAAAPDDAETAVPAHTSRQLAALGYVGDPADGVMRDGLASLALAGPDPAILMSDTEALSIAVGLLGRDEFEQALELAGGIDRRHPDRPYVLTLLAKSQLGLDRRDEARATLQRLVELRPCDEDSHEALRRLDFEDARYAAMLEGLEQTVDRCPEQLAVHNNLAWALATLPDDTLRDGARAIAVIRAAMERQAAPDPAYMDTLAAALAEAGRFDEAIATQREVLRMLRGSGAPAALLEALGQHLVSYEAKRPLRDPAPEPQQ
jgi:tetratricopeptide (TPR) repeat protein